MDGMPYTLKLPEFEGPLDLLVHLIEKDKVDIYDIPIESITEQYIAYLDSMQEYDLDGASEFLLMAAMLLQIKSRMLLPKDEDDEGEEGDPRQMLVEMLLGTRNRLDCSCSLMTFEQSKTIDPKPVHRTLVTLCA